MAKQIKLNREWRGYAPGSQLRIADSIAADLIRVGAAEEVETRPAPRNRAMSSPERTADRTRTTKARRVTNGS